MPKKRKKGKRLEEFAWQGEFDQESQPGNKDESASLSSTK